MSYAAESFARAKKAMETMIDEDQADVRVVRPVDRSVLGQEETNLVPLPITDDRDLDYVDPRLRDEADLIVSGKWDKPLYLLGYKNGEPVFNK